MPRKHLRNVLIITELEEDPERDVWMEWKKIHRSWASEDEKV